MRPKVIEFGFGFSEWWKMLKSDLLVTLQIPGEKLSPNNETGVYIEEPSVLVKSHSEGSQTWTMDKLNCRLDDMVSFYQDRPSLNIIS